MRAFSLDALFFAHSLRIALEASTADPLLGRSCALFYGLSGREPVQSDLLYPGNETDRRDHEYMAQSKSIEKYDLESILPSEGEDAPRIRIDNAAAFPAGSNITFNLRINSKAQFVEMVRLVDVRYSVQRASIFVDGHFAFLWLSTDRHWSHLDTHWREEIRVLPPKLTRGKKMLRIRVFSESDGLDLPYVEGGRAYVPNSKGPAWTEARWNAISVPYVF